MDIMNKIKGLFGKHDEQVDQGLEQAGEHAKSRFTGHDEQIDTAVDKAQEMTGEGDTTRPDPPPA